MKWYNPMTNPPKHLCIHNYQSCIDLITKRGWRQCVVCGDKK